MKGVNEPGWDILNQLRRRFRDLLDEADHVADEIKYWEGRQADRPRVLRTHDDRRTVWPEFRDKGLAAGLIAAGVVAIVGTMGGTGILPTHHEPSKTIEPAPIEAPPFDESDPEPEPSDATTPIAETVPDTGPTPTPTPSRLAEPTPTPTPVATPSPDPEPIAQEPEPVLPDPTIAPPTRKPTPSPTSTPTTEPTQAPTKPPDDKPQDEPGGPPGDKPRDVEPAPVATPTDPTSGLLDPCGLLPPGPVLDACRVLLG